MYFTETVALLSLAMVVVMSDEFHQRCTVNFCGNFSYYDIPKLYGGLFKTKEQIGWEESKWTDDHQRKYGNHLLSFFDTILGTSYDSTYNTLYDSAHDISGDNSNPGNHDFDQCCPTTRSYVNYTTLTNINGITRVIVHLDQLFPPQYQWIPFAQCSSAPHFCFGTCRMEKITLFLLVSDFSQWPPFAFDRFSVPGYCSCKSS
ncbi:uncharacterized protein LOC121380563 [Gigantopelta aegis]|uniref:uncharacterized protein LOC121380563 n=1 Tax=Gigantopelta aegis TaxID=1735272 RepID=UPI001B88ACC3|nr:uncharacterized protein LOC121380563 [Gigantopelta aegis]